MTKSIIDVAKAFIEGRSAKRPNARTDGTSYVLYYTTICKRVEPGLYLFDWGNFYTPTTTSHINAILRAGGLGGHVSYGQARLNAARTFTRREFEAFRVEHEPDIFEVAS